MSEQIIEPEVLVNSFDVALYRLAEDMREYDAISTGEHHLRSDIQAYSDQLDEADLYLSLELQPEHFARSALGLYIASEKLRRMKVEGLKSDNDGWRREIRLAKSLMGRKIKVTSLFPKEFTISTTRRNLFGELDGLSKFHTSRKGKVVDIDLSPKEGGYIELKGHGNKHYHIAPLINRDEYVPAFSIEE